MKADRLLSVSTEGPSKAISVTVEEQKLQNVKPGSDVTFLCTARSKVSLRGEGGLVCFAGEQAEVQPGWSAPRGPVETGRAAAASRRNLRTTMAVSQLSMPRLPLDVQFFNCGRRLRFPNRAGGGLNLDLLRARGAQQLKCSTAGCFC